MEVKKSSNVIGCDPGVWYNKPLCYMPCITLVNPRASGELARPHLLTPAVVERILESADYITSRKRKYINDYL